MQFARKLGDVVRFLYEARTHSYRRPAPENFTVKSAILAVAAATGLALTAGSASAHPPGYGGGYYGGGYSGGYYAPRPVVVVPYYAPPVYQPVYPAYGYGYGYAPYRPGLSITITIGSGYGGYGGGYYRGW